MLPVIRPAVYVTAAAVATLTVNLASLLLRLAEPTLPPVPEVGRQSVSPATPADGGPERVSP